jgi:hypothetical protein
MTKLPENTTAPKLKKSDKQSTEGENKAEDPRGQELSFDQIKKQSEELKKLLDDDARIQREEILKKREEEDKSPKEKKKKESKKKKTKKNKKDKDDRIDLKDIQTEVEVRKGGLPEHIKKLPENHPLRVKWEKGYQERKDGAWEAGPDADNSAFMKRSMKQGVVYGSTILITAFAIFLCYHWYWNNIEKTRNEIFNTIGYDIKLKNNKKVVVLKKRAQETEWLPKILAILQEVNKIKASYNSKPEKLEKSKKTPRISKESDITSYSN